MAAQRRGPDGSVRVAVNGIQNGEAWANVFWCLLAGGSTATQAALDSWTGAFWTAYTTNWKAYVPSTISVISASSTLFQPGETALHSVHNETQAGTATGAFVNDNAACRVVSWITNVYWRGGKPRTYIPGLGTTDTTDGKNLTAGAAAAIATQANTFHTAINTLSATGITQTQHGFVSFLSGGVERNPSVFFPISGGTCHLRVGTQRGRLGPWKP